MGTIGFKGGLYCYLITPFKENGDLDLQTLESLIERVIENGADGVTCVASTTEGVYLTEAERFSVVEKTCEIARGRVFVDVGIGALSTRQSLSYAEHAQKHGASTVILEMQTYLPGIRFSDIHQHYRAIAASISIPVRLYNIPHTTGVDMLPTQIAEMADISGIDSVKDATGKAERVKQIKDICGDRFAIFAGRHHNAYDSYLHGAIGWEGAFHPVFGEDMVTLHRALKNRDFKTGNAIYKKMDPLFTFFRFYGVPQAIKAISSWTDLKLGNPRPPLRPLSKKEFHTLQLIVRSLGYIQ